jgi:hypothetical protein
VRFSAIFLRHPIWNEEAEQGEASDQRKRVVFSWFS